MVICMRKILLFLLIPSAIFIFYPKSESVDIRANSFEAVVLLPGYGGSPSWSQGLISKNQGSEVFIFTPRVGKMEDDLEFLAKSVIKQLDAAKIGNFSIVGYSAGGVLARKVAQLAPDRVYKVVTIASPHQGSPIASLGLLLNSPACSDSCKQLVKDSEFLKNLPTPSPKDRWLSIYSETDEVVPASSANLNGSVSISLDKECGVSGLRHSEVASHPKTVDLAYSFLLGSELSC
jgi:pimeloyl-ACP methyl ester carboxylesterase